MIDAGVRAGVGPLGSATICRRVPSSSYYWTFESFKISIHLTISIMLNDSKVISVLLLNMLFLTV
jgi:hypothetical protein